MERLNDEGIVYQTVHSHYTYNLGQMEPKTSVTTPIRNGEYNTYGIELYADSVVYFVNDRRTFHYPRLAAGPEEQFPFDRAYYLLLDMQLGGSWVGEVDPKDLPVEMYIEPERCV